MNEVIFLFPNEVIFLFPIEHLAEKLNIDAPVRAGYWDHERQSLGLIVENLGEEMPAGSGRRKIIVERDTESDAPAEPRP